MSTNRGRFPNPPPGDSSLETDLENVPYNRSMSAPIGPIYLLADSALLFSPGDDGCTLPQSIRALLDDRLENKDAPTAAYIGASNRDEPAFYGIFEAAMDSASITERRMIRSRYSAMDNVCLNASDLIVLAGGDVAHGWQIMQSTGMRDVIVRRYLAGAVLVGVSAGAVQLGLEGVDNDAEVNESPGASSDTFRLVPFVIDVHDEDRGWERLRERVRSLGDGARGLGIPMGGGVAYHADHTLEPFGKPSVEWSFDGGELRESLLMGAGDPSGNKNAPG